MVAKFARLTHKITIQLHLGAESCIACNSRSRRPVRKLLDTPSYTRTKGATRSVLVYSHTKHQQHRCLKTSSPGFPNIFKHAERLTDKSGYAFARQN